MVTEVVTEVVMEVVMAEDTVVDMEVLVVGVAEEVALVQVVLSQVAQKVEEVLSQVVLRAVVVRRLVAPNLMGVLPKLEALTVANQLVVVQVHQVLPQHLNLTLPQKQTQNHTGERA